MGRSRRAFALSPCRNDERGPRRSAGKGMGGAPAIGDRRPRRDARGGEPRDHPFQHGVFPAMKMSGASHVDDEPVRRIGGGDRRVTLQRPESEPVEGFGVGGRIGVPHG